MTSIIETRKPYGSILNCYPVTYPPDVLIKIFAETALFVLEWEATLIRAIFHLYNAKGILTAIGKESFAQLERLEETVNEQPWRRIDVKNAEAVRTSERAGLFGCGKRKISEKERKRRERAKKAAREEAEERERSREWEESWERKLKAQEERDNAECCVGKGLCLKPRTRSNIWINVTQDRSVQEIHMSFKHVPVPRPKPPPLPPLRKHTAASDVPVEKSGVQKVDKKSGTIRSKKK